MGIKRIFLIGFMGSGKSTIGKIMKRDKGWDFIDLDDYFEAHYKTTIKQYFADYGEEAFRKSEQEILNEVIKEENVIIATGGGTPCFFDNMEVMNANGLTIYIKLSPEALAKRLSGPQQVRPLVAGKTNDELQNYIEEKLSEREPFYKKAKVVVDADNIEIDALVRVIEASWRLA